MAQPMSTYTVALSHIIDAYISALWRFKRREQHDLPHRPAELSNELCDVLERQVHAEFESRQMKVVRERHEKRTREQMEIGKI